jgi:TRAP-type C4-dicarboxylate transport system substrate-binding protein
MGIMIHRRYWLGILLLFLLHCLPAEAVTLKIATLAPVGSPWVESLRRLSAQWDLISQGRVILKIYPGGIAGEEADMIRKMRIGQLDGAALTQMGVGLLDSAILALSTPFLIQNEGELDHVMERTKPYFESRLVDKGYRLFALTKAGWVHFFGRKPLIFPEDLRRLKLGIAAGDADFVETWRKVGFNAFSLPFGDLLVGLQAGMIDAFYAPPLVAATFQWFGSARHMSALPIAPVVGAVVVTSEFIDRIPEELRDPLLATFENLEQELNAEMLGLEEEALEIMQEQGLEIHSVPPEAAAEWRKIGDQGIQVLLGKMIPKESYDLIVDLVSEYNR